MIRTVVVDDEPAALERYSTYVDAYGKGFHVEASCRCAAEALEVVERCSPAFLITDIRMPGEDGLTLLRQLEDWGWRGLAVVISGYDDFAYAQAAIRRGVFDFLLKPVFPEDMQELLGRVAARLEPGYLSGRSTRAYGAAATARDGARECLPDPVRRILDFLETHYDSRFSLPEAARAAGVSPAWISACFKKTFGCSLMEYVRGYRMDKARELLAQTDLPLKEIADRLAFPDPPTFSKLFRKMSGTSPGAYRKSMRGSGDDADGAGRP
jgi:Response regulator containing CheY-like receiver domain and AraC-type DNA-binding domain